MALLFAVIGWALDVFALAGLSNLILRIWGGVTTEPVLVSIPMFIFMGTLLERSGAAHDMLQAAERLMGRAPGGLAIGVMVMGTILAAPIGVVGASVVLLSLIALPQMLGQGYDRRLAIGTIASAGTLGILIPPSIMLVVMGEMLSTSAGALFAAAVMPGLVLSGLYLLYMAGRRGAASRQGPCDEAVARANEARARPRSVAWALSHDLPDGRGAGFDLRRLGNSHRERGRRRVRSHGDCGLQSPSHARDGVWRGLRRRPCQRNGVPHLRGSDRLFLRVPPPGR